MHIPRVTLSVQVRNATTAILSPCASVPVLVRVHVWVHIPGDPQSVHVTNATTTILSPYASVPVLVRVQVWVHIGLLGDPQSVQLRKATNKVSALVSLVTMCDVNPEL